VRRRGGGTCLLSRGNNNNALASPRFPKCTGNQIGFVGLVSGLRGGRGKGVDVFQQQEARLHILGLFKQVFNVLYCPLNRQASNFSEGKSGMQRIPALESTCIEGDVKYARTKQNARQAIQQEHGKQTLFQSL